MGLHVVHYIRLPVLHGPGQAYPVLELLQAVVIYLMVGDVSPLGVLPCPELVHVPLVSSQVRSNPVVLGYQEGVGPRRRRHDHNTLWSLLNNLSHHLPQPEATPGRGAGWGVLISKGQFTRLGVEVGDGAT